VMTDPPFSSPTFSNIFSDATMIAIRVVDQPLPFNCVRSSR
jgi:hypothetical protein